MDRFPRPLQVQQHCDGSPWQLLAGFSYIDPDHGTVEVPAGFTTDFASVKPLRSIAVLLLVSSLVVGWFVPEAGACLGTAGFYALVLYAGVVGYGNAAATIHDRLYRTQWLSRRDADQVFYNALRSSCVARWRALLMWAGVRLGGWWSYRRSK